MSSDFMRRLAVKPAEATQIPQHIIWRLAKNGRFPKARMRLVLDRPELRIYVQHPTPEFQLPWSGDDEL